ncbi:YdeI family protein [Curtobacterium sp. 9128]|uniref:YdeI/OmpD-associated family protein n=1 Tax=Curtobacterium sp. 9128 TaxID=1793722 RepID=UPI0011AAAD29|nr:YdeI/OmpD-associated family protein [Curtobacterium sp. 9128]
MDIEPFVVADAAAWRAWLDTHEDTSDGVWLALAKKGTTEPTTLTYAQALDEALCSGWIDGQKRSLDAAVFLQRFTPRRKASLWSERNIGLVAALVAAGRMRDRGQAEIDRAKADGRWERAYAGAASATVPDDLRAALDAVPAAAVLFAELDATNRYAVLHRVTTAPSPGARADRVAKLVGMLDRGETPYPRTPARRRSGSESAGPGGHPR